MNYRSRLRRLRVSMASARMAALLVTHLPDVRYMCGFTGSNAALAITQKAAVLVTDGRYTTQAAEQVRGAEVRIARGSAAAEACRWLAATRAGHAYYDADATTVRALEAMQAAVKGSGKPARSFFRALEHSIVAGQRMVKDAAEIALMAEAAGLGVRLFDQILSVMRPGMPESAVAAEIEYAARRGGAEGMSFSTIVASGPRSALPHGTASRARLPRRGFVTLDFGVILNGYCSDMTRTVHLGRGSAREREVYDRVQAAQQRAVDAVRAGVTVAEVDEAARGVLRQAQLAEHFTHSTGHGVGLEIHESPRIAAGQKTLLTKGMVITIEPGVYLPGAFGVRIEDTVVVEPRGARVLTPATKGWIEL